MAIDGGDVDRQPRVGHGHDQLQRVRNGGRGGEAEGGQEQQRQHVDPHDEQHRRDAANDGDARDAVDEVDDRALTDVVVDGGQQIGRAAHEQDVRQRELRQKPAERLPDGERVGEVDDEAEEERRGDGPAGGAARGGDHLVKGDLPKQERTGCRR